MAFSDFNELFTNRQGKRKITITPDTTLESIPLAFYVATTGTYTLLLDDDTEAGDPIYLVAGIPHPLRLKRLNTTGSVSTEGIIGIY